MSKEVMEAKDQSSYIAELEARNKELESALKLATDNAEIIKQFPTDKVVEHANKILSVKHLIADIDITPFQEPELAELDKFITQRGFEIEHEVGDRDEIGTNWVVHEDDIRAYFPEVVKHVQDELRKLRVDCYRAFQILEMYGVPKGRARHVNNGIEVLVSRWIKELNIHRHNYEFLKKELKEAVRSIKYFMEECSGREPSISVAHRNFYNIIDKAKKGDYYS